MFEIEFVRKTAAKLPTREENQTCINLFAYIRDANNQPGSLTIFPQQSVSVDTGVYVKIANNYVGLLIDTDKYVSREVILKNPTSIVESSNRDYISVTLKNTHSAPFTVFNGDCICHLLILQTSLPLIKESNQ